MATSASYLPVVFLQPSHRGAFPSDTVVEAAWKNGLGIHALVWFGFDGDDKWKARRDALFSSLHSNPKAKFVTRVVQFGSEPLYDYVLSPDDLASQVTQAKATLADLGIPVTVSDMAYGYQEQGGAPQVLAAIDLIDAHMLPFFSSSASTCKSFLPHFWHILMENLSRPIVATCIDGP